MSGTGRKGLTANQRVFVAQYLETRNAADAYRKAYCRATAATADTAGPRLLRHPAVAAAVEKALQELEARSVLNAERIDRELACAALFDPRKIFDPEMGTMLPPAQWPEPELRALAAYEEEALFDEVDTGEVGPRGGKVKARVQVGVRRKVKWHNKTDAQRLAFQRLGALVEKHEHNVNAAIDTADISDEEWQELAHLRHTVGPRKAEGA
jgi:phage terminase small subunit